MFLFILAEQTQTTIQHMHIRISRAHVCTLAMVQGIERRNTNDRDKNEDDSLRQATRPVQSINDKLFLVSSSSTSTIASHSVEQQHRRKHSRPATPSQSAASTHQSVDQSNAKMTIFPPIECQNEHKANISSTNRMPKWQHVHTNRMPKWYSIHQLIRRGGKKQKRKSREKKKTRRANTGGWVRERTSSSRQTTL